MYYFSLRDCSGIADAAQIQIYYLFVQTTQLNVVGNSIKGTSQPMVFI